VVSVASAQIAPDNSDKSAGVTANIKAGNNTASKGAQRAGAHSAVATGASGISGVSGQGDEIIRILRSRAKTGVSITASAGGASVAGICQRTAIAVNSITGGSGRSIPIKSQLAGTQGQNTVKIKRGVTATGTTG